MGLGLGLGLGLEDARLRAGADARQHGRHHGAQAGPRRDVLRRELGEMLVAPADERHDTVVPDVAVVA